MNIRNNKHVEILDKERFHEILKDNMLIFGKAGIGKATSIIFFDEKNTAPTITLNTLYEISHTHKSHKRRRIPYKYGKHSK